MQPLVPQAALKAPATPGFRGGERMPALAKPGLAQPLPAVFVPANEDAPTAYRGLLVGRRKRKMRRANRG